MRKPSRRPRWGGAAAVSLVLASAANAGRSLDRIQSTGAVRIAYRTNSVPFSYLVGGQPVGYAIDLCREFVGAIGKVIGAKVPLRIDFVEVTAANRINTMATGGADLECESTTNTAERRKLVAFSIPHYVTGARFAVRTDSTMAELSDFKNKRVVSTTGTTPLKAIRDVNDMHEIGMQIREVPDHERGLVEVEHGNADAFVMDEVLLAGLISTRPQPATVKIVGKYQTVEALAIILPHDDKALKDIVDAEMKQLIRNGSAARLLNHWFMEPIPPRNVPIGLPLPHLLREFWMYPTDWIPEN